MEWADLPTMLETIQDIILHQEYGQVDEEETDAVNMQYLGPYKNKK